MTTSRHRLGLTLVELLIVMSILTVVTAAIATVWASAQRTHAVARAFALAQSEARIALQTIEREVRSGSRASFESFVESDPDVDVDPDEDLVFRRLEFDTMLPNTESYTRVTYFVTGDQLFREQGGITRAVTQNVTEFSLVAADTSAIAIQLGIRVQNLGAELRTLVAFRNP